MMGLGRGGTIHLRGFLLCVWCVWVLSRIWVCTLMWKRGFERGWRTTPNVRKEHGAVQSKVQVLSLSLFPSLFFQMPSSWASEGNKGALLTSLFFSSALFSPSSLFSSHSCLLPLLSLFLWLHFCIFFSLFLAPFILSVSLCSCCSIPELISVLHQWFWNQYCRLNRIADVYIWFDYYLIISSTSIHTVVESIYWLPKAESAVWLMQEFGHLMFSASS